MWYREAKINFKQLIANKDIVASVIVFKKTDNGLQILLERRGSAPMRHRWAFPGGHVENGERLTEAAVREIKEETSLTLDENDLTFIGHYDYEKKRDKFNFIFATEYKGDEEAIAGSDAEYIEWIDINNIPPLIWNNFDFIEKALSRLYNAKVPESSHRGLLIVFEGLDGAGKTTQVENLKKYLQGEDYNVVFTKWSDGDIMAPVIKKFKNQLAIDPKIFSLIHATDLLERYNSLVKPALNNDCIVLCDRYYYTSYARDSVRNSHAHLDDIYESMRKPDIIFYCKAPIEKCIDRASDRGAINYYAAGMDLSLHHDQDENLRHYYHLMDKAYDNILSKEDNCFLLNTDRDIKEISEEVQHIIDQFLDKKSSL